MNSYNNRPGFIPVFNINVANGGIQQPAHLTDSDPVYSSYTGKFIGYGHIPRGTSSDAIEGQSGFNKPFHCITQNSNGDFMTHLTPQQPTNPNLFHNDFNPYYGQ